ncbi:MAG: TonB-dependent receptor [Opitutaceae bacterium]|nr:TonB-dependent receptor [Opitutaceae bacterium]
MKIFQNLGVTLCVAASVASGQAAPAPARSDEVIALGEFMVTAEKSQGYRATNAITATGIGTRIADTPLPISVISAELIADTGAFDVREVLNLVPGVLTNPRNESGVVIRGFSGLIAYRNGQYRRQLMTTWNMDRTEVIKGPAGIFFGAVRPGGIVNTVTAKPVFSGNFTDVKLMAGNEEFVRGEFFTNYVASKTLAIRVGAGGYRHNGEREFENREESYSGASATWKPTANQILTLDLEAINKKGFYLSSYPVRSLVNSKVFRVPGAIAAQANVNQLTTTADTANRAYLTSLGFSGTFGAPNFYPLYDMFAPYDYRWSMSNDALQIQRSRTVDLDYLLKLGESIVFQSSANYAFDNTSGTQPSDGDTRPYADGSLRFRTESFINIRESFNFDNKVTWRFSLGKTKHTIQLGQEYQRVVFTRPGYFNSVNNTYNNSPGNNTVAGVTNVYATRFIPGVSTPASVNALLTASGQTFNIRRWSYEEAVGYFLVDQIRLFEDRVQVLAGGRYNAFRLRTHFDRPVSNSSYSRFSPTGLANFDYGKGKGALTPQAGAIVKVLPDVGVFATYSESIEANTAIDADGNASEPIESKALDAGIKTELLGGRLASTIAYYKIDRGNLSYADTAKQLATGRSPYFIFGNSEASEGIETEINWAPSDAYNLLVGWAHTTKAETSKSNNATFVGRRFGGIPENTYTVWNRYAFRNGPLKNFAVAGGLQHNDATNLSQDPQIQVTLPSFTVFNLMLSYRFKVGERDYRAQLNVKNLFDKRYREGADGYFAPARTFYLGISTRL